MADFNLGDRVQVLPNNGIYSGEKGTITKQSKSKGIVRVTLDSYSDDPDLIFHKTELENIKDTSKQFLSQYFLKTIYDFMAGASKRPDLFSSLDLDILFLASEVVMNKEISPNPNLRHQLILICSDVLSFRTSHSVNLIQKVSQIKTKLEGNYND
jgi:hypothetical protein